MPDERGCYWRRSTTPTQETRPQPQTRKVFSILVVISVVGKMIKAVDTRCHISKLKCTKFDFGWGCAPDPAEEALPQTCWLDLREHMYVCTSTGKESGEVEGSTYVMPLLQHQAQFGVNPALHRCVEFGCTLCNPHISADGSHTSQQYPQVHITTQCSTEKFDSTHTITCQQ